MAWIDDRIWCHPKFVGLSSAAFAAYCKALAYSSGMSTRGYIDVHQQRLIGCTPKTRDELVTAGVWDWQNNGDTIRIHDWDDHNGKRDERRERDRERKKKWRETHKDTA